MNGFVSDNGCAKKARVAFNRAGPGRFPLLKFLDVDGRPQKACVALSLRTGDAGCLVSLHSEDDYDTCVPEWRWREDFVLFPIRPDLTRREVHEALVQCLPFFNQILSWCSGDDCLRGSPAAVSAAECAAKILDGACNIYRRWVINDSRCLRDWMTADGELSLQEGFQVVESVLFAGGAAPKSFSECVRRLMNEELDTREEELLGIPEVDDIRWIFLGDDMRSVDQVGAAFLEIVRQYMGEGGWLPPRLASMILGDPLVNLAESGPEPMNGLLGLSAC